MKEQQKKLVFSSDTDLASRNNQTDRFDGGSHLGGVKGEELQLGDEYDWWGGTTEDVDFEMPGFQSHSQINQLQSEVARLQVECQHWKDLAKQKKTQVSE